MSPRNQGVIIITTKEDVIRHVEAAPTDSPEFWLFRAVSNQQELLSQRQIAAATARHRTTLRVHGLREKCGIRIGGNLFYALDQVNAFLADLEANGLLRPRKVNR